MVKEPGEPIVVANQSGQTDPVLPEANPPAVATPTEPVATVEPSQPTIQEPVLTEQKILELVGKAAKQAAEETLREVQSRTDKAEARIRKEVQEQIDRLKGIGVELTDEQTRQLGEQTREKFAQAQVEPQATPPVPPVQVNPINEARDELEREYGIGLIADDLEAKMVKLDGTELQFLRTYEQALQAKKDRLNAKSTPQESPTEPVDPKTRIVTAPKQGAIGLTVSDPDQLFEMGYKKD